MFAHTRPIAEKSVTAGKTTTKCTKIAKICPELFLRSEIADIRKFYSDSAE